MAMLKWDFKKLSTVTYETNRYEIAEDIQNIVIETDTANIILAASEDGKTVVECCEQKGFGHSVKTENGTLEIKSADTGKWYDRIGIGFQTTKITVYLPAGEYGTLSVRSATGHTEIPSGFTFQSMDISATTGGVKNEASAVENIKISTSTGNIRIAGVNANALELSVSTGKITVSNVTCTQDMQIKVNTGDAKLTDVSCAKLSSEGTTGDLGLTNVTASEKLDIQRSTGDVTFESCDAGEIFVKTTTGTIRGTLRSEKIFMPHSNAGSIRVPETESGGKCKLVTNTGNIKIEILK